MLIFEAEKRNNMMKIIVDDKIPYIREPLAALNCEVVYMPGSAINKETVKDADALVIRTRTHCSRELLEGSKVKFIATATIGYDHIDAEYCKTAGIEWTNAAGCNSGAVEQYVHSSLLLLQKKKGIDLKDAVLGIVGVGHVGSRVARMAKGLGMKVLLNDPPRKDNGEDGFVGLDEIAEKSDIITFHTPLIKEGKYKTYHLADASFFGALRRRPFIINTSRGNVIDTVQIKRALSSSVINDIVMDVWENEPNIDRDLLNSIFIATPHIAGYSADGKMNATRSSLMSLYSFFNINKKIDISLPPSPFNKGAGYYNTGYNYLEVYNPMNDTAILRKEPENFESLRGNYNLRREIL